MEALKLSFFKQKNVDNVQEKKHKTKEMELE